MGSKLILVATKKALLFTKIIFYNSTVHIREEVNFWKGYCFYRSFLAYKLNTNRKNITHSKSQPHTKKHCVRLIAVFPAFVQIEMINCVCSTIKTMIIFLYCLLVASRKITFAPKVDEYLLQSHYYSYIVSFRDRYIDGKGGESRYILLPAEHGATLGE